MNKTRTKFLIFLVGMVILLAGGALIVVLLTQFVAAFQQGADPASIFHGHSLVIPLPEEAQWRRIVSQTDTQPTRAQREEMISAYWQAWNALDRAYATGDVADLPTYWAGDAYAQALKMAQSATIAGQLHRGHTLDLSFFSDDGSVVAFRDRNFGLEQRQGDDILQLTASATVVMTLDNGFWRIRSLSMDYQ